MYKLTYDSRIRFVGSLLECWQELLRIFPANTTLQHVTQTPWKVEPYES